MGQQALLVTQMREHLLVGARQELPATWPMSLSDLACGLHYRLWEVLAAATHPAF